MKWTSNHQSLDKIHWEMGLYFLKWELPNSIYYVNYREIPNSGRVDKKSRNTDS